MKNIIKSTLVIAGLSLTASASAQSSKTGKNAEPSSARQDTTKAATKAEPSKKQDAGSNNKQAGSHGTTGGTRMAINEQGVPTKGAKKQAKSSTPPPVTGDKKKGDQ